MVRVLFVCLGNICRSPTAEGVMRALVEREGLAHAIEVDSAGTADYHVDEAPDPRTVEHARRRGYDLSPLRGRQVERRDFEHFDLILAMDRANRANLLKVCPPERRDRVRMMLEFASASGRDEVPDPYYGGPEGFDHVLDLVEDACAGVLAHLRSERGFQGTGTG